MKKLPAIILSCVAITILISFLLIDSVYAVEIEVQGEGRAEISENFTEVQTISKNGAVRLAVTMAVRKVIGPEAMDNPKIQQKFDDIVSQFNVYKIKQSEMSMVNYIGPVFFAKQCYVVTVVAILCEM